jgi:hypothetical protein
VLFVAQRHQRPRAYGRWAVLYRAPGRPGLDHSLWNRRRAQTRPGLAGLAERRR